MIMPLICLKNTLTNAVVKIQSVFRRSLARKKLESLKTSKAHLFRATIKTSFRELGLTHLLVTKSPIGRYEIVLRKATDRTKVEKLLLNEQVLLNGQSCFDDSEIIRSLKLCIKN